MTTRCPRCAVAFVLDLGPEPDDDGLRRLTFAVEVRHVCPVCGAEAAPRPLGVDQVRAAVARVRLVRDGAP